MHALRLLLVNGGEISPIEHLRNSEETLLSDLSALIVLGAIFRRAAPSGDAGLAGLGADLPPAAVAVLTRAGVIGADGGVTARFAALWQARGSALLARIDFILKATRDLIDHGDALLADPERFMQRASVFAMFDYSRGFEPGPAARADTERWTRYVAALSDLEGPPLSEGIAALVAPTGPLRILEIGGNIGAFAAHLIRRLPVADYTILDIPQVCAIGADHARAAGVDVRFRPGDMHRMAWDEPGGTRPDCIVFKSVLHDWPPERARAVLRRALDTLAPGGRIVIAERGAFRAANLGAPAGSDAANMVFAPFYRDADVYGALLGGLDPALDIRVGHLMLDMRWFVMVAVRP